MQVVKVLKLVGYALSLTSAIAIHAAKIIKETKEG